MSDDIEALKKQLEELQSEKFLVENKIGVSSKKAIVQDTVEITDSKTIERSKGVIKSGFSSIPYHRAISMVRSKSYELEVKK